MFGSVYIFSDGLFDFDAIDLNFATSDNYSSDTIEITGGEVFNPTFNTIGGERFAFVQMTIDAEGRSGNLFLVNVINGTGNGIDVDLGPVFDPGFVASVGPNGAFLLARLDIIIEVGSGSVNLDFSLGTQGALQFPINSLNPSFGTATLDAGNLSFRRFCLGDVNLSGSTIANSSGVDFFDIAPFVSLLSSGGFERQADCNGDGSVNFLDVAPFIDILARRSCSFPP